MKGKRQSFGEGSRIIFLRLRLLIFSQAAPAGDKNSSQLQRTPFEAPDSGLVWASLGYMVEKLIMSDLFYRLGERKL